MEDVGIIKYQWIKGDKIGTVETVKEEDGEWTLFKDGGRINTALINEYMIPFDGVEDPIDQVPETITIPTTEKAQSSGKADSKTPMRILIDKQKEYDTLNLNVSIPVKLINKPMYDILAVSFGDEEAAAELGSFIEHQIQTDDVVELLKENIKSLIRDKYQAD